MVRISLSVRTEVKTRANDKCEYCHSPERFSVSGFSIEHVVPQSKGGMTELENLAFACQQCNNHKYNLTEAIDSVTKTLFPLFNPRRDEWSQHFAWDYQYLRIVGLSGTGRATVEQLKLNRSNLINLRHLLSSNGLHP